MSEEHKPYCKHFPKIIIIGLHCRMLYEETSDIRSVFRAILGLLQWGSDSSFIMCIMREGLPRLASSSPSR